MSDTRTDLPSPNAPNFEQRVREALMTYMGRIGNPMDRGLTLRDLMDNGLLKLPDGYSLRPGGQLPPLLPGTSISNPEIDLTPPPQPTGFQVAGAISHIFIEHDAPLYLQGGGHLRTRVYGVTINPGDPAPVFGDAVELTQFSGTVHAHPTNPATTWRLWIKWETQAGVLSPTPAGGTNGAQVTTGQDVSLLLDALTGQLTASELNSALGSRIDLIDADSSTAGSVNARIQTEVGDRIAAVAGLQDQIDLLEEVSGGDFSAVLAALNQEIADRIAGDLDESNARVLADADLQNSVAAEANTRGIADSAVAAAQGLLGNSIAGVAAGLVVEQSTRENADSATASQTLALAAQSFENKAALLVEQQVRADSDDSLAGQTSTLAAVSGATSAALQIEQQSRASADDALSGQTLTIGVQTANTSAALVVEQQSRADADEAAASQITSLAASVGINAGLIQVEQEVRADADSAAAGQLANISAATANAAAAISFEQQTRADADSATASQVAVLSAATGDSLAAIKVEQEVRTAADDAAASQITSIAAATANALSGITTEQDVRAAADFASASQITTLGSAVGANAAALVVQSQTSSDADSAQASQLTVLTAATANTSAGLFSEQQARASQDSAQASSIGGLAVAAGVNSAGLLTEQQARASQDGSLAASISSITAATGANAAAIATQQQVFTSADSAQASQITTLSASAGANTAAIQAESSVRASADNSLFAQYTVKVDLNGYVSGFGLASESTGATPTSAFVVRADSFSIASPSGPGITPASPFIVRTTPINIGGVDVPAGVYMTDTFVQNGTITNAKIANLAVDSAKISGITVDKLLAGSIAVGQHIQSTGYVAGSAGWRIDGNGNAEFSNVTVRGTVTGSSIIGSTITGSIITGATIRTAASGQRIQMDADGLLFLTGAVGGKYGTFKYGNARKYGSGVLVYFNNATKRVPFYVAGEQNVADIHLYNRGADPTGATYEAGDMICVNGRLKIFVPALGGWRTLALEP
jgi:hypothetical protein